MEIKWDMFVYSIMCTQVCEVCVWFFTIEKNVQLTTVFNFNDDDKEILQIGKLTISNVCKYKFDVLEIKFMIC